MRAALLIAETYTRLSPAEQAAELGVSRETCYTYRALMTTAGVLDPTRRATKRPYTQADAERAAQLARQGCTIREIAQALGRPEHRVSLLLSPLGGIRALRAQGRADSWYTATQAGALLDIHQHTVAKLCEDGVIAADRTKLEYTAKGKLAKVDHGNKLGSWRISRAALCDFVRDRAWWMTYGVRSIQDTEIRQLAETVRRAAAGRWVKLHSVALDQGGRPITVSRFSRWRALGWPGPGWEVLRRGTTDWLWLPEGSAHPAPREPLPHRLRRKKAARVYPKAKTCTGCGATFVVRRQDRNRLTCSEACTRLRRGVRARSLTGTTRRAA